MQSVLRNISSGMRWHDVEECNMGKIMTNGELNRFINEIGRSELYEELSEYHKPEYRLVRCNGIPESRYLKAVKVTLIALGYDEEWVSTVVDEELRKKYIQ